MRRPRLLIESIILILLSIVATDANAQSSVRWSQAEPLWGYEDAADTPYLVSDLNHTVHAFNSRAGEDGAVDITYRQWTLDQGWTEPIDVILSPEKGIARVRGVVLDNENLIHVLFYGGDEQGASIYYTYAPVTLAERAGGWSTPLAIGFDAGPVSDAAMIGDGNGGLFAVFTGRSDDAGVYTTYSTDGGLNWSEQQMIYRSVESTFPTHYSMEIDQAERVHIAWSQSDLAGNGQAIYYTRLDENRLSWTDAVLLADRDPEVDYEADWPALVYYNDELLITYQDALPASKWMRRSRDGGSTWTEPVRVFPDLIGENGRIMYAKDSEGTLHAVFGNRTSDSTSHGLWHTTWQNGSWEKPSAVVSGPRVVASYGEDGFDPTKPSIVVSQGNTLLAAWVTDPGAGLNGVFYAHVTLDTPETQLALLPTIAPTLAPAVVDPIAIPTTSTPLPSALLDTPPLPNNVKNPARALIIGIFPVLALVGIVALVQITRHRR